MVQSGGQNRCLCSSLPKVSIIQTHMLTGTARREDIHRDKDGKGNGGGRGGGKGTKAGRETEAEERVRREKSQLRQFDFKGKAWIRNLFLELASPRDNQG